MATSSILTFAETDTGSNLLTDAEYLADGQRSIGNQPGVARAKLVNKSLRQASLLSAGLAKFIADNQSLNVVDSLTPAQVAEYLANGMAALVRRVGLNANAFNIVSGAGTIPNNYVGSTVYLSGSGTYTTVLPLAASFQPGTRIEFLCGTSSRQTLARQGAEVLWPGGPGGSTTTMGIGFGENLTLESNGASWFAVGGSAQLEFGANFSFTANDSGRQVFPGGRIEQWVKTATITTSTQAVLFAPAFPNNCFAVFITCTNGAAPIAMACGAATRTGFNASATAVPSNFGYFAIGN